MHRKSRRFLSLSPPSLPLPMAAPTSDATALVSVSHSVRRCGLRRAAAGAGVPAQSWGRRSDRPAQCVPLPPPALRRVSPRLAPSSSSFSAAVAEVLRGAQAQGAAAAAAAAGKAAGTAGLRARAGRRTAHSHKVRRASTAAARGAAVAPMARIQQRSGALCLCRAPERARARACACSAHGACVCGGEDPVKFQSNSSWCSLVHFADGARGVYLACATLFRPSSFSSLPLQVGVLRCALAAARGAVSCAVRRRGGRRGAAEREGSATAAGGQRESVNPHTEKWFLFHSLSPLRFLLACSLLFPCLLVRPVWPLQRLCQRRGAL